jgi:hypothetical protein
MKNTPFLTWKWRFFGFFLSYGSFLFCTCSIILFSQNTIAGNSLLAAGNSLLAAGNSLLAAGNSLLAAVGTLLASCINFSTENVKHLLRLFIL